METNAPEGTHPELNPPASPCYAPPPWTYTRARILNVVCRAQRASGLRRWVPAPLELIGNDGLFVMFFLRVPAIPELGKHYHSTESGILIPTGTPDGRVKGSTFALMIVDNDVALAAGREIWGYPKKLGSVRFEESETQRICAAAHHMSYRDGEGGALFGVDVVLDGSGRDLTPIVSQLEPRLLRRVIPDPYAPVVQSVEVLKVVHVPGRLYEERTGRGNAYVGRSAERLDELGEIETLGATFRVCDFTLPYAQRIS
jgi:acetoacetate decarboxylase